ncbi:hypothetical protein BurJ1DRAFT_1414 [Burkholderiales bacterium JOSHI_001]|nr:hypothetical protein BurJ1DRAFT_1414 [Burkholderiales bacterium JOSHI_001]
MNTRTPSHPQPSPRSLAMHLVLTLGARGLAWTAGLNLAPRPARSERGFDALDCEANAMTPGPAAQR